MTSAFDEVGRLPMPGDNVAIAVRRLEAGDQIQFGQELLTLDHTVLEGHRFAVEPIAPGETLLSWELPFGRAIRPIDPGNYVCNQGILDALSIRRLDFALPEEPNFDDHAHIYRFDESRFEPGRQVPLHAEPRSFMGYERGVRGVGTRNFVVILGTSSRTASFARLLAARTQSNLGGNLDGVVAVAHTEGGGWASPNNHELLLRTLAGFMVNPNVGAVLAVDYGTEAITNQAVQEYMAAHNYPLDQVPHRFLSIKGPFEANLREGERIVIDWLDPVGRAARRARPLTHLKAASQCGGSDSFSGVSANPLVGWVAREIVQHGGAANLAETDELIGAEGYVLQNVRDAETARRFLHFVERFKERAAWHGTSADGNPSGGNKYRGLYNIILKSLGAARKKSPQTRLDYVIDYGAPMSEPGYYFMDSPGNDLESIAGQIASGCNIIFFTTGNGSITNFPFVPTIKVVTTSQRFELLADDMDFNAGSYLEGTPMDELGRELFELTVEIASGARSVGERAGHSQVSIWRNWQQQDDRNLERLLQAEEPDGEPLAILPADDLPSVRFAALRTGSGHATDQLGLILPTSLCAGQIARMCADRLNVKSVGRSEGVSRFVSLVHTEGCGVSGGATERLYARTLIGYLTHPLVRTALVLEHGCEKTHNDFIRSQLRERGIDPGAFGWASVQLDGGIEKVMDRVEGLVAAALATTPAPASEHVGLECLHLGLLGTGPVSAPAAAALACLTRWVVGGGGTVVVPANASLLAAPEYVVAVLGERPATPALAHGQRLERPGFYVMETPTEHWVETLTGLGATGVEILLAHVGEQPVQGHPMLPLVQLSGEGSTQRRYGEDLDLVLDGPATAWADQVLQLVLAVASRRYAPKLSAQGNTDFQITRGLLGISM